MTDEERSAIRGAMSRLPFSAGAQFRWSGEDFVSDLLDNLERLAVEIKRYVRDDVRPMEEDVREYRRLLHILGTVLKRVQAE